MKLLTTTIILTLTLNSLSAQCDCEKVDQKNGTFYTLCQPFLSATDSMGEIKLGVSALGESRFIHLTISFAANLQVINGGLTIHTSDGKSWACVLVQRNLSEVDSVQTAYGLFVTSAEELALMQNNTVQSISFYLADGKERSVKVTYLSNNLPLQLACLED